MRIPHADLGAFSVRCAGVEALESEADGTLVLRTAAGDLRMRHPRSWEEERDGTRRPVEVQYRRLGRNRFGFASPERRRNRPLVVDPGLLYSTFLGGSAGDAIGAIAVDSTGGITVGGITGSPDFPTTPGAHSRTLQGAGDAFVTTASFTTLRSRGTPRPRGTVRLTLTASDDAGPPYQLRSSLGTGPIAVGRRKLHLSPDALLALSVSGVWPSVFIGYQGTINGTGQAQAAIRIPSAVALIGQRVHTAFVTLSPPAPFGIRSISNTETFTIVP